MLPRADLSRMPALDLGGRFARGEGHIRAALLVRGQQLPDHLRVNDLVAGHHEHVSVKAHPFKQLGSFAGGVTRAERLVLEGVGGAGEAPVDGRHHALGHAADDDHIEHRAAEVVGLQRADDDRHAQHIEADLVRSLLPMRVPLPPARIIVTNGFFIISRCP